MRLDSGEGTGKLLQAIRKSVVMTMNVGLLMRAVSLLQQRM